MRATGGSTLDVLGRLLTSGGPETSTQSGFGVGTPAHSVDGPDPLLSASMASSRAATMSDFVAFP